MDSKLYKEIGKFVKRAQKNGGSTLTEQNLLYVIKVATDVAASSGTDFDMLVCEGTIGMMKAEERYDPEKNDNFVKYAAPSVRGYMLNAINRQSSLIHIPANLMPGFKKGQEKSEKADIEYDCIDASNYDTLGVVDNEAFAVTQGEILMDGLNRLGGAARTAMEMKLRIGKYGEQEQVESKNGKTEWKWKYKNNIQSIADELEVTVPMANKIYKDALSKLSNYCQKTYKAQI